MGRDVACPVSSQDARPSQPSVSVVVAVRLGALGPWRDVRSMPTRRPYPSDLSDARWELIEPVLSAWRFERRGRALNCDRPPGHDLQRRRGRDLVRGQPGFSGATSRTTFRTGTRSTATSPNGPTRACSPSSTACSGSWSGEGGRDAEPSACVIDAQSVKTSTSVPATGQGIDAGRRSSAGSGASSPTPSTPPRGASHRSERGTPSPARADGPGRRRPPRDPKVVGWTAATDSTSSARGRSPAPTWKSPDGAGTRGFTPIPKRWAVERTYG